MRRIRLSGWGRDIAAVILWSLFWAAVVAGIVALVLEWRVIERMFGS